MKKFEKDRVGILKRIGSMIESSLIYGHLTAVENLQILQKIYDISEGEDVYKIKLTLL